MNTSKYTIRAFIKDAKQILDKNRALEETKALIGERLQALSRNDELMRFGVPLGPADGSTGNFLLWREPPYLALVMAQFDRYYQSPVHDHGNFWVVCCGYRGMDRWDMYERLDDGSKPGYAELKLIEQIPVPPGKAIWIPMPPRSIHSHTNEADSDTLELVFSATRPTEGKDRLIFDIEERRCWPSWFRPSSALVGESYPEVRELSILGKFRRAASAIGYGGLCPICLCFA